VIKKPNSFLEYLQADRFLNKIKNSIFSWCINHKDELINRLDGYDISYIAHVEEIDLEYKNVWIDSKENTDIQFDLAVEVEVTVEAVSGKHHDRDIYSARIWLTVVCEGSLAKKLWDFKIVDVLEFNKTKPSKPLSGDFVPFMSRNQYDEYANEILEAFYYKDYPEAKTNPLPINTELLASKMGLTIVNTCITKDRSIFGQIFFADAEVELFNTEKKENEKKIIKKNTMLVDDKVAYLRSFGSRNLTIAHECVHSYYHRKTFLFAQMINNDIHYIQCRVNGAMRSNEFITTTDWMEIQANALAPCLLMPKESFVLYANKLFDDYSTRGTVGTYTINEIVDELARTYQVTLYAARKRLIDLGFELAVGAYNWVDGHFVRPYIFKQGSLATNETFTISYKDVYKKVLSNPKIAMNVLMNQYVFVENHLCINHPEYVEKDRNGDLILSDYALANMDECCVKFKYKTIRGFSAGSEYGLMCYLSRDTSKEIEYDLEIINNPSISVNDLKFEERYKVHKENVDEILKTIAYMPFGQILEYLMKYLDISIKELEIDSGLNERTIRRYLNSENKVPDKRTVIALLRTLNLPSKICDVAIKQAGISFKNGDDEDDALLNVLMTVRGGSARDANRFLQSIGFEPLTREG
jgi:transcriptional regulator with XRE-family HTH domain